MKRKFINLLIIFTLLLLLLLLLTLIFKSKPITLKESRCMAIKHYFKLVDSDKFKSFYFNENYLKYKVLKQKISTYNQRCKDENISKNEVNDIYHKVSNLMENYSKESLGDTDVTSSPPQSQPTLK